MKVRLAGWFSTPDPEWHTDRDDRLRDDIDRRLTVAVEAAKVALSMLQMVEAEGTVYSRQVRAAGFRAGTLAQECEWLLSRDDRHRLGEPW